MYGPERTHGDCRYRETVSRIPTATDQNRAVVNVTDRPADRIQGVSGFDPGVGEYVVTPSERVRDWDEQLTAALKGDASPDGPRHFLDVERPDEGRLLEVVEGDESDVVEWVGSGDGEFTGATYRHFLIRSPAGDPVLVLHRRGVATTYALRAAATGAVLATWSKCLGFVGNWRLAAPDGTTRATVQRERSGWNVFSSSARRTQVLRSTDDSDVARFERNLLEGGRPGRGPSELTVSVDRSAVPVEVCLALGVGIVLKGRQSSGYHGTGGP